MILGGGIAWSSRRFVVLRILFGLETEAASEPESSESDDTSSAEEASSEDVDDDAASSGSSSAAELLITLGDRLTCFGTFK